MEKVITMDYGSGGIKTSELIDEVIRPAFSNAALDSLGDGAVISGIPSGKLAFSTDSFVVDPLVFPGGNIGKLSVCGTVNDVSMCGAIPKWMSFSLILEEGVPLKLVKEIVESAAEEAKKVGIQIVTGDTKVVERGHGDGIYINTAGIGEVVFPNIGPDKMKPGDVILVSGPVGDHGATIMMERSGLGLFGNLKSDCMPLNQLAACTWETGKEGLHCLRDATRGGVATTLNEFTEGRNFSIRLFENQIPIRPEVHGICELLGLDPLYCANEGRMIAVVAKDQADAVLEALKKLEGGEGASKIGVVSEEHPGKVILTNNLGAGRILTKLTGAQLPRIC